MRRADGPITPPVSRCTACGSWVWRIDHYGCPECLKRHTTQHIDERNTGT